MLDLSLKYGRYGLTSHNELYELRSDLKQPAVPVEG